MLKCGQFCHPPRHRPAKATERNEVEQIMPKLMRKILFLGAATAVMMTMVSCCGQFGNNPEKEIATIIKYKDGAELSDYFHANKSNLQRGNGERLMLLVPLTDGYYIDFGNCFTEPWQYQDVVVLNFTMDDYTCGNIPEDWIDHWQDYVLTENPFMEGGVLVENHCLKDHGGPWYNNECTNTNNVDTAWLNLCIKNGELWDYAWQRYTDTTAI